MKQFYVGALIITVLLAGCATPSTRYAKLSPLTQTEQQTLTCEQLDQETLSINNRLKDIGEVSTADKAMANVGVGVAILRATLGGFNSEDIQLSANVKEQQDALQKANARLSGVQQLQIEKECAPLP